MITNTFATCLAPPAGPASRRRAVSGGASARRARRAGAAERPPIVLLGEIRQVERILLTFTRPYFGTASRRSKTLAVSRKSGGSSSSSWIGWRPALRSRFSCARRLRMSLARWSASMRCTSERSGAAMGLVEDSLTGDHGRRLYIVRERRARSSGAQFRLDLYLRLSSVEPGCDNRERFAGYLKCAMHVTNASGSTAL